MTLGDEPQDVAEQIHDVAAWLGDWLAPNEVVVDSGVYCCLTCDVRNLRRLKAGDHAPACDGHTSRWGFWSR
jgi:hypothetical protein